MKADAVAKLPGFQIYIAEYQAQCKGIEKLRQVSVEQAKHQSGGNDSQLFAIDVHTVDQLLAENVFFNHRSQDHHKQHFGKKCIICGIT